MSMKTCSGHTLRNEMIKGLEISNMPAITNVENIYNNYFRLSDGTLKTYGRGQA